MHAGHRVGGIIAVMDADAPEDLLRRGREALTAAEWATARSCFEQALELSETGTALNGLGQAAHFQGRHLEAIEATERAFAAYRREDNPVKAAEMARWLAFLHGAVHGNFAAASGWMAWAERLLEGVEECVEHGRLALDRAPWTDDPAERERLAMAAVTIARRFGDRDLEFSAQALLGHAYVASGRVEEGMSLIDEAMAANPGGEVARIHSIGEIYCRLLGACELATDVRRAEQWIATARRFVQWGDFVPPTCRLHHGGILIAVGRWAEAEEDLLAAARVFEGGLRAMRAAPLARLAGLRVRQGRLEEAERLLEGNESRPAARQVLATIALARGDLAQAQDLARLCLEGRIPPTLPARPCSNCWWTPTWLAATSMRPERRSNGSRPSPLPPGTIRRQPPRSSRRDGCVPRKATSWPAPICTRPWRRSRRWTCRSSPHGHSSSSPGCSPLRLRPAPPPRRGRRSPRSSTWAQGGTPTPLPSSFERSDRPAVVPGRSATEP